VDEYGASNINDLEDRVSELHIEGIEEALEDGNGEELTSIDFTEDGSQCDEDGSGTELSLNK
jgi:hypothetical protein